MKMMYMVLRLDRAWGVWQSGGFRRVHGVERQQQELVATRIKHKQWEGPSHWRW